LSPSQKHADDSGGSACARTDRGAASPIGSRTDDRAQGCGGTDCGSVTALGCRPVAADHLRLNWQLLTVDEGQVSQLDAKT
jgi:hypothetical protein